MRVGVLVADESAARIYETEHAGRLQVVLELEDKTARTHDRDFKSDRPGRVFDHAPSADGRRGAVAHHGTGGERTPREHEAQLFARRICEQLEQSVAARKFERLIIMAAPHFLGILRKELPTALKPLVKAEVHKDLMHQAESVVLEHLPVDAFQV